MKMLIWGAGAIGGTVGAHLARAGHDVTFVDREAEHVAAIRGTGLRISTPVSEFTVRVPALTPDDLQGEFDTVLLAVKAQDTLAATRLLAPHLSQDGVAVSVQNGLCATVIAGVVGPSRTAACFINFGADYQEPGHILFGSRGSVVIGELDGRITPRIEALHRVLLDFEPAARLTDNIMGFLWGKMVYGMLLTATALTNETMADSLSDPRYRDMYIALGKEVQRVAATQVARCEAFDGYEPAAFRPGASREETGRSLDAMADFWRHSAKQRSGVWRDIAVRHRKTESTESEDIIAVGAESGIPTPLNQELLDLIHEVEDGRLPQALSTLDLLKEAAR